MLPRRSFLESVARRLTTPFIEGLSMNGTYLLSGHSGPLTLEESSNIQRIADALAGSGLLAVRLGDLESAAIRVALNQSSGNRTRAARQLGISVRTLQRKLKREAASSASLST